MMSRPSLQTRAGAKFPISRKKPTRLIGDGFGRTAGVDHPAALRLSAGDFKEAGAQLRMKIKFFALELVGRAWPPPLVGPFKTELRRQVEDEGHARRQPGQRDFFERRQAPRRNAAFDALIGAGQLAKRSQST